MSGLTWGQLGVALAFQVLYPLAVTAILALLLWRERKKRACRRYGDAMP